MEGTRAASSTSLCVRMCVSATTQSTPCKQPDEMESHQTSLGERAGGNLGPGAWELEAGGWELGSA